MLPVIRRSFSRYWPVLLALAVALVMGIFSG
jgi:hypothetical protein